MSVCLLLTTIEIYQNIDSCIGPHRYAIIRGTPIQSWSSYIWVNCIYRSKFFVETTRLLPQNWRWPICRWRWRWGSWWTPSRTGSTGTLKTRVLISHWPNHFTLVEPFYTGISLVEPFYIDITLVEPVYTGISLVEPCYTALVSHWSIHLLLFGSCNKTTLCVYQKYCPFFLSEYIIKIGQDFLYIL